MKLNVHRLAAWLLALAMALGFGVLSGIAAAEAAVEANSESAPAQESRNGLQYLASASGVRFQPGGTETRVEPLHSATLAVGCNVEWGSSVAGSCKFAGVSFHLPAFLDRVSYWTTGPPRLT